MAQQLNQLPMLTQHINDAQYRVVQSLLDQYNGNCSDVVTKHRHVLEVGGWAKQSPIDYSLINTITPATLAHGLQNGWFVEPATQTASTPDTANLVLTFEQTIAVNSLLDALDHHHESAVVTHRLIHGSEGWQMSERIALNEITPDYLALCLEHGFTTSPKKPTLNILTPNSNGATLTYEQVTAIETWFQNAYTQVTDVDGPKLHTELLLWHNENDGQWIDDMSPLNGLDTPTLGLALFAGVNLN